MIFLYSSSLSSCHLFLISSVLLIPYIFCPLLCPSCMKYSLGVSNFLEEISAAAATLLQSCPTLCDPIDGSPPGSAIPGILQARTLVWVAISFSSARKWKVKVKSLSRVWLLATPWTVVHPWDSPGKNTGVGCHFLLQCMKVKSESESEVTQSCLTLSDPMDCSPPMGFSRQEYWSRVPLPSPEEISSLSHSIVFLYFLHWSLRKVFF